MTPQQIDLTINTLRDVCDPRGYDLLEALRRTLKEYEKVARLASEAENESHSRHAKARLRLIDDEAEHDVIRIRP